MGLNSPTQTALVKKTRETTNKKKIMYYAFCAHLFDTPNDNNTCVCVYGPCSIYMYMQCSYKRSNFTTGTQPRGIIFTTYSMYMFMHRVYTAPQNFTFHEPWHCLDHIFLPFSSSVVFFRCPRDPLTYSHKPRYYDELLSMLLLIPLPPMIASSLH